MTEEPLSRFHKKKPGGFNSAFYSLMEQESRESYTEQLTRLCNNPSQFSVQIHEASAEPKTKNPKVFLSYSENIKKKDEKWSAFDYVIESRVFNEATIGQFDQFMEDLTTYGYQILQDYRFYSTVDEFTSIFYIIVIYATKNENDNELSRKPTGGRVNWGNLIPVKASY